MPVLVVDKARTTARPLASSTYLSELGVWLVTFGSLFGDEEAVSSNPATPTVIKICPLWSKQWTWYCGSG